MTAKGPFRDQPIPSEEGSGTRKLATTQFSLETPSLSDDVGLQTSLPAAQGQDGRPTKKSKTNPPDSNRQSSSSTFGHKISIRGVPVQASSPPGAPPTVNLEVGGGSQVASPTTAERTKTTSNKDFIQTLLSIQRMAEELIREGTQAFQQLEQTQQQLTLLKNESASKTQEIERLRLAQDRSRESIANLLRAVESSNDARRDDAQSKLVEARVRGDLVHWVQKHDKVQQELAERQRRVDLLQEDLDQTRAKLARVQTAKKQLERDQRATLSMAKSLQGNVNSDADYHKRKVSELNMHVQGLSTALTEKNRQIEDLRRQLERNSPERIVVPPTPSSTEVGDKDVASINSVVGGD